MVWIGWYLEVSFSRGTDILFLCEKIALFLGLAHKHEMAEGLGSASTTIGQW